MKPAVASILATALLGIASVASEASTLTIKDVNEAGQRIEHDPNAISHLRGKRITLTLTPRPKTVYFDVEGGDGIVVVCLSSDRFDGGKITSTIRDFELDADSGGEYFDVLTLSSCR